MSTDPWILPMTIGGFRPRPERNSVAPRPLGHPRVIGGFRTRPESRHSGEHTRSRRTRSCRPLSERQPDWGKRPRLDASQEDAIQDSLDSTETNGCLCNSLW